MTVNFRSAYLLQLLMLVSLRDLSKQPWRPGNHTFASLLEANILLGLPLLYVELRNCSPKALLSAAVYALVFCSDYRRGSKVATVYICLRR